MDLFDSNTYPLQARFQSVSGLKPGARIEMSGVKIGSVEAISYDTERYAALVQLRINNKISLSEDVIASIRTAGLIGEKYIKLEAGGSDVQLKPGGTIVETESALDIEELISKYMFGKV